MARLRRPRKSISPEAFEQLAAGFADDVARHPSHRVLIRALSDRAWISAGLGE
jgi:hypothetical protein